MVLLALPKALSVLRWSVSLHLFFQAASLTSLGCGQELRPVSQRLLRIACKTHSAERRLILALSMVEFAHCAHVVGVKVVYGTNFVDDVASLQPVMVVENLARRRVVALSTCPVG